MTKRRFQDTCLVTGLAVLGLVIARGHDAQSGAMAGSISISGGVISGGGGGGSDPPYDYVFDVYLTSGSISPSSPGSLSSITINGLVGVASYSFAQAHPATGMNSQGSTTSQPPTSPPASETWIVPSGGIATSFISPSTGPPTGTNFESNVTWNYILGPSTITWSGTNILLGVFTVETAWVNYAANSPPVQIGSTLTYSYNVDGTPGASGQPGSPPIIVQSLPEPSSVVLMLAGGAILPIASLYRRRSRIRRSA